jgi:hypothetical protein
MLFAPFPIDDFENLIKDKKEIEKLKKFIYYSNLFILILFLLMISMIIVIYLGDYFIM